MASHMLQHRTHTHKHCLLKNFLHFDKRYNLTPTNQQRSSNSFLVLCCSISSLQAIIHEMHAMERMYHHSIPLKAQNDEMILVKFSNFTHSHAHTHTQNEQINENIPYMRKYTFEMVTSGFFHTWICCSWFRWIKMIIIIHKNGQY